MAAQLWPAWKPRPGAPADRWVDIVREIAARRAVTVDELEGPSRVRRVAWPRQELMAEAYRRTCLTMPAIAQRLGGRDHSTVVHGIQRHTARISGPLPRA